MVHFPRNSLIGEKKAVTLPNFCMRAWHLNNSILNPFHATEPIHATPLTPWKQKRGVEREQLHEMSYCEICLTLSGGCKLHWRAINEKWTAINICDPRRRSHYNSFTFQILRGRFKIQSRCLSRFDFKKPPQSCYCNKYTLFAIFRIGER